MTALAAEVLWTRHLTLLLGGTVYTFALIVAVFLLGHRRSAAPRAPPSADASIRAPALGVCQVAARPRDRAAPRMRSRESLPYWPIDVTLPTTAAVALQLDLLRVASSRLPAALLWGASFPLALAAAVRGRRREPRRAVGRLYAANTLGAIVGALGTTFVLVVIDRQPTHAAAHDRSRAPARRSLLLAAGTRRRRPARLRRAAVGAALAARRAHGARRCRPSSSRTAGSCRRAASTRTSSTSAKVSRRRSPSRRSRTAR